MVILSINFHPVQTFQTRVTLYIYPRLYDFTRLKIRQFYLFFFPDACYDKFDGRIRRELFSVNQS